MANFTYFVILMCDFFTLNTVWLQTLYVLSSLNWDLDAFIWLVLHAIPIKEILIYISNCLQLCRLANKGISCPSMTTPGGARITGSAKYPVCQEFLLIPRGWRISCGSHPAVQNRQASAGPCQGSIIFCQPGTGRNQPGAGNRWPVIQWDYEWREKDMEWWTGKDCRFNRKSGTCPYFL